MEAVRSGLLTFEYERNLWGSLSGFVSFGGPVSIYTPPPTSYTYRALVGAKYYVPIWQRYPTEGLYLGLGGGFAHSRVRWADGVVRPLYQGFEFRGVLGGQCHLTPRLASDVHLYYGWVPQKHGVWQNSGLHRPDRYAGQQVGLVFMLGYAF